MKISGGALRAVTTASIFRRYSGRRTLLHVALRHLKGRPASRLTSAKWPFQIAQNEVRQFRRKVVGSPRVSRNSRAGGE